MIFENVCLTQTFINEPLVLVVMAEKKKQENIDIPEQALKDDKCGSCNTSIVNDVGAVRFPCPNCGKSKITRCSKCRKIVAKYKCPSCGFEGPN